jgi:hypothetical protein
MSPEEVLDLLRTKTDAAKVLESLKRARGPRDLPIIAEIKGQRFRLRFLGGQVGLNPSLQHLDGSVEVTPDGSGIEVEPKGFAQAGMGGLLLFSGSIAMGIVFGVMLSFEPALAILVFLPLVGLGLWGIVYIIGVLAEQKRRLTDFLARLVKGRPVERL